MTSGKFGLKCFLASFLILIWAFTHQASFSQENFKGTLPQYDPEFFASKREYLWIMKGREFAGKKNYSKAFDFFKRAIQANPKSTAYYWQGLSYERMASDIIYDWYKSQKKNILHPEPAGSRQKDFPRLDSAAIKKQLQQAIDSYEKAAEIFPNLDYIQYQLGKAEQDFLIDIPKAETHLYQAVQLNPDQMVYRTALANCYLLSNKYSEARKEAETALRDSRPIVQAEAHYVLGRIELEQKNFTKAIEELKLSLALNSAWYSYHYIGKAYEWIQQMDRAIDAHKNFIELVPSTLQDIILIQESVKDLQKLK